MRYIFLLAALLMLGCSVERSVKTTSVPDSAPLLFTVGTDSVFADEFIYVYKKNNINNDTAFTRNDVEDYLGLYQNFKLKVHEARVRGMDTTSSYLSEMKSYEAQLKKPYLTETSVTDQLVKEAYNRFRQEVRARHILIQLPENASPEDTLAAWQKIKEIREKAVSGEDFGELASRYSEDPSAAGNGGDLQYFTSMQMVYPFETAAYNTPVGEVSDIIRSQFGYHIIEVNDKRPANNKVVVSHIMIRHDPSDSARARNKIFEIYDQAAGGVDWDQLVSQYSEDMNSRRSGGRLQPFGLRQMPYAFQETAFALNTGEISDPVRTDYGWHIIRLEQRIPLPGQDKMEGFIRERIANDVRSNMGEQALVRRLRQEWNMEEYISSQTVNSSVLNDSVTLFRIGDSTYRASGFKKFHSDRSEMTGAEAYEDYLATSLIAYEEDHLEEKYEEYRMLLREYREGILLFQLMEDEIWSRAGTDTTGLREFFEARKEQYLVPDQIRGTMYALNENVARDSVYSYLASDSQEQLAGLMRQYEKMEIVTPREITKSRSDLGLSDKQEFTEGEFVMTSNGLLRLDQLSGGAVPELNEIRGRVIADYQEFLEKEWIRQLKQQYDVQMNEKGLSYVFETLVR